MTPTDPSTPEQWQVAVDAAAALRMLADVAMYGLISGGPTIDVARCDEILAEGAKRGITRSRPDGDLATDYVIEWNRLRRRRRMP